MLDPLVTVLFIVAPIVQMAAIVGLHALHRAYGRRELQILWWSLGVTLQLLSFIAFILVSGFTRWLMGLGLASYPILVAVTLAAGHYRDVFYSRRAVRAVAWAKRTEVLALATTVARQELRAVCSTFSTYIFLVVPAIAPVSSITTGVLNCASSKQQEVKINTNCLTSSSLTAFVRRVSLSCRPSSAKAGGETARR